MSGVARRLTGSVLILFVAGLFLTAGVGGVVAYEYSPPFQQAVNSFSAQVGALFNFASNGPLHLSVVLTSTNGSNYSYSGNGLHALDVLVANTPISQISWFPSITVTYTGAAPTSGSCTVVHQDSDDAGVALASPGSATVPIPSGLSSGGMVNLGSKSLAASALDTGSTGAFSLSITISVVCTYYFASTGGACASGQTLVLGQCQQVVSSTKSASVGYTRPVSGGSITSQQVNISTSTTGTTGTTTTTTATTSGTTTTSTCVSINSRIIC